MPQETTSRPRATRLSLKAAMLVILLLACLLGWVVREAQTQRDAVAAIEAEGRGDGSRGQAQYAAHFEQGPRALPAWRRWIGDRLGIDYVDHVIAVFLEYRDFDLSSELSHVGRLKGLEELYLTCSQVTDEGLANIDSLHSLRKLDLSSTEVTDRGMAHLEGLRRLESLMLSQTRVGDAGLAHLENLRHLQNLHLDDT